MIDSAPLSFLGSVFPTSTSVLMVAFTGYIVMMLAVAKPGHSTHYDQELAAVVQGKHDGTSVWPSVGWFVFLFGMTAVLGFIISIAIFITTFLLVRSTLGLARYPVLHASSRHRVPY